MDPKDKGSARLGLRAALRRLPAYVYLDDLFRGRHVLEVACGDGAGAHFLARAGAASVIGLDRASQNIDNARARHRLANLTFAVAEFDAIELPDHSIDVVAVPAGEELARWPAFLQEARRVMARDGSLVVVAPSGDRPGARGVGYHDLLGRLEPVFGQVRMIGVTPFVGFALVEYADNPEVLDVELDTSLTALGGGRDSVTDYVAIAGAALKGNPRGYVVVELPPADGLVTVTQARAAEGTSPEDSAELPAVPVEDSELKRRLARAVEERSGAEAELGALRARLGQAEEEIGRVAAQAARELGDARRALHMAQARSESLDAQLAEARRTLDLEPRLAGDDGELAEMERDLAASEAAVEQALAERAVARERARDLEIELAARDTELANLRLEMAPLEVMVRAAQQHEAEMRGRRAELAERDAYLDEMRQELDDVIVAERAATEAAREASMRAGDLEAEVRELRVRLAAAEGELLKVRVRPTIIDVVPLQKVAELEAALAERSAVADKAAARWKEAEGKTDELWRKIGELQKELVSMREQGVENARAQRQAAQIALTRAVDEASKKLVSSQDALVRTERERQELEREVGAQRTRAAELERERDEHEREAGAQRTRAAELERERDELRARDGDGAGRKAEGRVAALEEELRGLEAVARAETAQLSVLKQQLAAAAAALPDAEEPPASPETPPAAPESPPAAPESPPAEMAPESPPAEGT